MFLKDRLLFNLNIFMFTMIFTLQKGMAQVSHLYQLYLLYSAVLLATGSLLCRPGGRGPRGCMS